MIGKLDTIIEISFSLVDHGVQVGICRIKKIRTKLGIHCKQKRKFKAEAQRPAKGLFHHSDRGSQYCAYEYRQLPGQFDMITSMSGKENCFDNAPTESLWGMLKQELVYHGHLF
jgi:hypothetical protein